MWGIPFNKMPVSSCIATLLPRCFGDEVTYLHVNRFKEIYKTYLKKMHLFLERYYAISLAFCTEIYGGKQHHLFPPEWEGDMAFLHSTPALFLGAIELKDLTLVQLEKLKQAGTGISASLLEFLQLARDLSLSRAHFNPLSANQCESIIRYIRHISLSNALLFNCAQKKALEVFFLSTIVDVLICREELIKKVQTEQETALSSTKMRDARTYILSKISFYQDIKTALIKWREGCSVQFPSTELTELDFGAGRGYYSVYKAIELDRRMIAIEGSLKHAEGLCRYIAGVKPNEAVQTTRSTTVSVSLSMLRVALLYVDDSTSGARIEAVSVPIQELSGRVHRVKSNAHIRGSVIQGAQLPNLSLTTSPVIIPPIPCLSPADTGQQYSAIGLHACGPLSVIALRMLMQKDVTSAFTIPCCYGHLTKDTFPISDQGSALINGFFSATKVKEMFREYHADTIPREFLTYAASDSVFTWPEVIETIQSYWARATVELARRQQSPISVKRTLDKDLKELLCGDNASLAKAIVLDLQRSTRLEHASCSTAAEDSSADAEHQKTAQNAIEYATSYRWAMQAHYLARKVSGHVFETFILMDRLAGLIELVERFSLQLCAGILPALTELSPRGFLVYGFKW